MDDLVSVETAAQETNASDDIWCVKKQDKVGDHKDGFARQGKGKGQGKGKVNGGKGKGKTKGGKKRKREDDSRSNKSNRGDRGW